MKFYDASQLHADFTEQHIKEKKIIMINCSSFISPKSVYQSVKRIAHSL